MTFIYQNQLFEWYVLIICMSLIKNLCTRCMMCVKSCFKSEEEQLEQKMMELQNRIHSPVEERYRKFQMKQLTKLPKQKQIIKQQNLDHISYPDQQFSFGQSSKNNFKTIPIPNNIPKNYHSKDEKQTNNGLRNQSQFTNSQELPKKNYHQNQSGEYRGHLFSPHSPNNRNSNNSSDSFFTMQSGSLGSSNSISRRTFHSLSKKSSEIRKAMLNGRSKGSQNSEFKSIQNREQMFSALPSLISADSKVQKYSQAMIEWNQKEYQKYVSQQNGEIKNRFKILTTSTQLSTSQLHKLSSNSHLDEMVNKLQDYYMFFQPEEMIKIPETNISANNKNQPYSYMMTVDRTKPKLAKHPSLRQTQDRSFHNDIFMEKTKIKPKDTEKMKQVKEDRNSKNTRFYEYHPDKGYYINHLTNFKCSYQCQSDSIYDRDFTVQSHIPVNFMKLVTFFCNTSNPLQFLYWFNSIQVRARLYDFNSTQLISNGVYPTFHVQQYSGLLPSKNKYQMVRQIELVKFENQPDKQYIMQLDSTYGSGVGEENGRSFKNLLRFQIGENSMVEIYSESSEIIERGTHGDYFGQQWRNFQQKLLRDQILMPLWKYSQNSSGYIPN